MSLLRDEFIKEMEPCLKAGFDFEVQNRRYAEGKLVCKAEGRHEYEVYVYRVWGKINRHVICSRCHYDYVANAEYKPVCWSSLFKA